MVWYNYSVSLVYKWGFPYSWRIPNSWLYFMENPNEQWMRTGGTPLRKPPILFLSSRHWLEEILHHLGWLKPYNGMFTTYQLVQHFGKPSTGIHRSWVNISWLIISLQFESRWFSHVTQVKNIPQFYFHPFVSFILPGSMLIILSCLLITGGELVALGEAAEDQVRHQNILGDPWWNVWKKTSENHRKTTGKMERTIVCGKSQVPS